MVEHQTHVIIETQSFDIRAVAWRTIMDGKGWTNASGNPTYDLTRYPLPDGHIWFNEWEPVTSPTQTDMDGWAYAPALTGPWTAQNWSNSLFRRRSWARKSARHAYTFTTYENERWFVLKGFSGARLPTDRAHWSDVHGKEERRKEQVEKSLPTGYRWEGEWAVYVKHPEETDPEGWEYAADFPSQYQPAKFSTAFVRRRKWERKAVRTSVAGGPTSAQQTTPLVISRQALFESHAMERETSTLLEQVSGGSSFASNAAPAAAAATTETVVAPRNVAASQPAAAAPTVSTEGGAKSASSATAAKPVVVASPFNFAEEPVTPGSSKGTVIPPASWTSSPSGSRTSAAITVSSAMPTTTRVAGDDDFDDLLRAFEGGPTAKPFRPASTTSSITLAATSSP